MSTASIRKTVSKDREQVEAWIKSPPKSVTQARITITPEIASLLLAQQVKNRKVRPSLVAKYADEMQRGVWLDNGDTIRLSKKGKLLDGQHRLLAIIKSGIAFSYIVVWGLDDGAQNVMDVGSRRSLGDALGLAGYSGGHKVGGAVRIIWQVESGNPSPTRYEELSYPEWIDFVNTNGDEILAAVKVGASVQNKWDVPAGPVTAAYYECAKVSQDDADKFFTGLRTSAGLAVRSPIIGLQEGFKEYNRMRQKGAVPRGQAAMVYNMIVEAFNLYRQGKRKAVITPTEPTGWLVPA